MQKLTIKKIAEFRSKGDRFKLGFVKRLGETKSTEEPVVKVDSPTYWATSLPTLIKSFKEGDISYASDKIPELRARQSKAELKHIKGMYESNITVLSQFTTAELKKLRPVKDLDFPKTPKRQVRFMLKGFELQVDISHIFTFSKDGFEQVGAIWIVAKKPNGYDCAELGMFTSLMYRYLEAQIGKTRKINAEYCIAIDAFKKTEVNYAQLERKEVANVLEPTLEEISRWLKTTSRTGAAHVDPRHQQRPGARPGGR